MPGADKDGSPELEQIEDDFVNLSGRVLEGRYQLIELIGQGGMGSVYRGEHVTIRRQVAVKVLHPSLAQLPELARRFEREAFAIGRIDHPHCINVMDFGKLDDGSLYLVMEFVEGQTLGTLLEEEGRLEPVRAFHIIRQVLRGLRHAHRAGIVHRDVKPENVILSSREDEPDFAKVLDFGIAKLVGEAAQTDSMNLTQAGVAFGTPTYLSPEQALGEESTPSSDLYSMTVMLFEMLAGRPPFVSDDKLSLLGKHATLAPPRLAETSGVNFPEVVEAFVARGLAKRPTDRFHDDDSCLSALDSCLAALGATQLFETGELTPLPPGTTSGARPALGPKRWPLYAGAGILALLLIVILAAVFSGGGDKEAKESDSDATVAAKEEVEPTPAEEAAAALEQGDPDKAIQLLEASGEEIEGDAGAQLQLGHAYAHKSQYKKALEAYGRALSLDGSLADDETLGANVWVVLDDEGAIMVEAAALLLTHKNDEKIQKRVLELARHEREAVRMKATALAESAGLGDQINRLAAYILDLEQGKTCAERRQAVAKLRALGDPGAIPALQKAKKRTNGRRWRRRKVNKCLIQAADDAIGFLKNMKKAE